MTKAELIAQIARESDISKKESTQIVQSIFDGIADSLASEGLFRYPGFGTFKVSHRAARMGRTPQTGEALQIGPSKGVNFKPSAGLKDTL